MQTTVNKESSKKANKGNLSQLASRHFFFFLQKASIHAEINKQNIEQTYLAIMTRTYMYNEFEKIPKLKTGDELHDTCFEWPKVNGVECLPT